MKTFVGVFMSVLRVILLLWGSLMAQAVSHEKNIQAYHRQQELDGSSRTLEFRSLTWEKAISGLTTEEDSWTESQQRFGGKKGGSQGKKGGYQGKKGGYKGKKGGPHGTKGDDDDDDDGQIVITPRPTPGGPSKSVPMPIGPSKPVPMPIGPSKPVPMPIGPSKPVPMPPTPVPTLPPTPVPTLPPTPVPTLPPTPVPTLPPTPLPTLPPTPVPTLPPTPVPTQPPTLPPTPVPTQPPTPVPTVPPTPEPIFCESIENCYFEGAPFECAVCNQNNVCEAACTDISGCCAILSDDSVQCFPAPPDSVADCEGVGVIGCIVLDGGCDAVVPGPALCFPEDIDCILSQIFAAP